MYKIHSVQDTLCTRYNLYEIHSAQDTLCTRYTLYKIQLFTRYTLYKIQLFTRYTLYNIHSLASAVANRRVGRERRDGKEVFG